VIHRNRGTARRAPQLPPEHARHILEAGAHPSIHATHPAIARRALPRAREPQREAKGVPDVARYGAGEAHTRFLKG